MIRFVLLLLFASVAHTVGAQVTTTDAITVNGLQLGSRYTMQQMTDALGAAPTEISELAKETEIRGRRFP